MSKSKLSIDGEILKKAASLVIEEKASRAVETIDSNVSTMIEKAVDEFLKTPEFKKLIAQEIVSVLDGFIESSLDAYFDNEGYELVSEFVLGMLKERMGLKVKKK